MKRLFPFLALFIVFQACKKEKPQTPSPVGSTTTSTPVSYDTIYPGPYLPAYPGSWWIWQDTYTGSFDSVSAGAYVTGHYDFPPYGKRHLCVPVYDNHRLFMYRYFNNPNFVPDSTRDFLRDSVALGDSWSYTYIDNSDIHSPPVMYTPTYTIVKMKDTLYSNGTLYNDVIGVGYSMYVQGYLSTDSVVSYYARNIGLVKRIRYSHYSDSIIGIDVLTGYHINH